MSDPHEVRRVPPAGARRGEELADALSDWAGRYERAGLFGRVALLGSGAARVAAGLIEHALGRAAGAVVGVQDAARKENDPNVVEARIVDETRDDAR